MWWYWFVWWGCGGVVFTIVVKRKIGYWTMGCVVVIIDREMRWLEVVGRLVARLLRGGEVVHGC
jgi:hypothetical protein